MLEKSGNFAHASETGENLRLIWVSEEGVAKWLDSATYKYSAGSAPRATFHVHVRKSVHLCNLTIPYKKVSRYEIRNPTGSRLFWISRHILCHFCHFHGVIPLTNSSQRFIQMNTKLVIVSKALCDVKLRRSRVSSEGVSVASCQILMFRHETGSCYISGMLCPICTKLHHVW